MQAKWNQASPLSTIQQKKQLVEEWIKLGKYGRRVLFHSPFPYPK